MKMFYFVGGPKPGFMDEFLRRLDLAGGPPAGWSIYPHAASGGKALHLVEVESLQAIMDHLQHFNGIYEYTTPVEIVNRA